MKRFFLNEVRSLNQYYCIALNTTFNLLEDCGYSPSEIPGRKMCVEIPIGVLIKT